MSTAWFLQLTSHTAINHDSMWLWFLWIIAVSSLGIVCTSNYLFSCQWSHYRIYYDLLMIGVCCNVPEFLIHSTAFCILTETSCLFLSLLTSSSPRLHVTAVLGQCWSFDLSSDEQYLELIRGCWPLLLLKYLMHLHDEHVDDVAPPIYIRTYIQTYIGTDDFVVVPIIWQFAQAHPLFTFVNTSRLC